MNEIMHVEIAKWVDDVGCMTKSLRLVASHFSEDQDTAALNRSLAYPISILRILRGRIDGTVDEGARPSEQLVMLSEFSEATARAISPLLETILVYEPTFLQLAQERGEKDVVLCYGLFRGAWGRYLCRPVWNKVPSLAPSGWTTTNK